MQCVRGWLRSLVLALVVVPVLAGSAWCAALYQVSTIQALLAGMSGGQATFDELARHGNFGLGTFVDLDGEMVALDGKFYQVRSDGRVRRVGPNEGTPFAEVVFFRGSLDLGRLDGLDFKGLKAALDARLPDPDKFYAVRVDGVFARLTARSVPAQSQPWPTLAEAIKKQRQFPMQAVRGTLIGIYAPASGPGLAPTGWHFHFLAADRRRGGHVLDLKVAGATARGDMVDVMTVAFPPKPLPRRHVVGPAAGTE